MRVDVDDQEILIIALARLLSGVLEGDWQRWVLGISFIAMAAWTLIPDKDDGTTAREAASGWAAFVTTSIAFFLVEIGDKTQIATVALGARYDSVTAVVLGTTAGMMLAPLLLGAAASIAWLLPSDFRWVLAGYFALTLAYSFELKRIAMVDTIALAGLYTSRIVAGAAAVNVPLSFWLLLFAVFLFLSLAMVKRYAELDAMRTQYANPLYRIPETFMEIFPVGLVVALLSAASLRFPKFLPARR